MTDAKWLLIYDNVETPMVFETYWPVSSHGSILITTRKLGLTTQPISQSIELYEFSPILGARFLVHNLRERHISEQDAEFQNARKISSKLFGHTLAISQMAALILAKGWTLEKFLVMYDKHTRKIHGERKSGWKYPGYEHAIDTVWQLSFSTLDSDAKHCLGIISLLMPDSILQELFEVSTKHLEDVGLSFCEDEYSYAYDHPHRF